MPFPNNHPTLADLASMAVAAIAALPPALLAALQGEADAAVAAADRAAEALPQSISLQIVRTDAAQKLTNYLDQLAARNREIEAAELAPAPEPAPAPEAAAPAAGTAGEIIS